MRPLVPALLLMFAALVAGLFWTRTPAPATPPVATVSGTFDDQTLAAMLKDNQLLREQMAVLAAEVAGLRAALKDRPASTMIQAATTAQADMPDTPANKPVRDALERYRAATGSQRPANLAELTPFFTDPQQADNFLKNREAAATAKPERQQLKTELKTELKQRLKSGSAAPAVP